MPEVAARHHVEQINAVIAEALQQAGFGFTDIRGRRRRQSARPARGTAGRRLGGQTLRYALSSPDRRPSHRGAYLRQLAGGPGHRVPRVCLVASGGHSEIFLVRGHGDYQILGRTRDDAAGEAFDKSARLLGLPYPGGVTIDRLAREGNGNPRPSPCRAPSSGPTRSTSRSAASRRPCGHATRRPCPARCFSSRLGGIRAGGDYQTRWSQRPCGPRSQHDVNHVLMAGASPPTRACNHARTPAPRPG